MNNTEIFYYSSITLSTREIILEKSRKFESVKFSLSIWNFQNFHSLNFFFGNFLRSLGGSVGEGHILTTWFIQLCPRTLLYLENIIWVILKYIFMMSHNISHSAYDENEGLFWRNELGMNLMSHRHESWAIFNRNFRIFEI